MTTTASALPAQTETRRTERYVAAAGGALAVIAAVLPWASVTTGFGTVSRNGLDDGGDGLFTVALGVLGLLAALQAGRALIVTLIAGLLVAGIGVYDIIDVSGTQGLTVGAGLYLTVLAGVVMFAASAVCLQKPK